MILISGDDRNGVGWLWIRSKRKRQQPSISLNTWLLIVFVVVVAGKDMNFRLLLCVVRMCAC